jgi:hypothetical protein
LNFNFAFAKRNKATLTSHLQKETQGNFNFAFAKRNKATLTSHLQKETQGNFNALCFFLQMRN